MRKMSSLMRVIRCYLILRKLSVLVEIVLLESKQVLSVQLAVPPLVQLSVMINLFKVKESAYLSEILSKIKKLRLFK
jgi:hypothetical protein